MIKFENNKAEVRGRAIDIIHEISSVIYELILSTAEITQKSESEVAEDILVTINGAIRDVVERDEENARFGEFEKR